MKRILDDDDDDDISTFRHAHNKGHLEKRPKILQMLLYFHFLFYMFILTSRHDTVLLVFFPFSSSFSYTLYTLDIWTRLSALAGDLP